MSEDTGFAAPSDDVVGGEGESAEPTRANFERSPIRVLQGLETQPLKQAIKAIEYIDALDERKRKYLRVCSTNALNLIAQNGPAYLSAVQATQG